MGRARAAARNLPPVQVDFFRCDVRIAHGRLTSNGPRQAAWPVRAANAQLSDLDEHSQNIPWLLLCLIVQAALMTHRLDLLPMWNDELFTVRAAQQTVGAMLEMVRGDVHPPLYFLLAHYWIRIAPGDVLDSAAMAVRRVRAAGHHRAGPPVAEACSAALAGMVSGAVDLFRVPVALFPHGAILQLAGLGIRHRVLGRVALEPGIRFVEKAADMCRIAGGAALHALRAGIRGVGRRQRAAASERA